MAYNIPANASTNSKAKPALHLLILNGHFCGIFFSPIHPLDVHPPFEPETTMAQEKIKKKAKPRSNWTGAACCLFCLRRRGRANRRWRGCCCYPIRKFHCRFRPPQDRLVPEKRTGWIIILLIPTLSNKWQRMGIFGMGPCLWPPLWHSKSASGGDAGGWQRRLVRH